MRIHYSQPGVGKRMPLLERGAARNLLGPQARAALGQVGTVKEIMRSFSPS